jgi:hypothetical protein
LALASSRACSIHICFGHLPTQLVHIHVRAKLPARSVRCLTYPKAGREISTEKFGGWYLGVVHVLAACRCASRARPRRATLANAFVLLLPVRSSKASARAAPD